MLFRSVDGESLVLLGNGDNYVRNDAGIDIPALVSKSGESDVVGKVIDWNGTAFTLKVSSGTLSTNYNGGTLNVAGVSATITTVSGTNIVNVSTAPTIPFVLHDDDDDTNTTWGLPRDPNTGFLSASDDFTHNKFKPAYIRPVYDIVGSHSVHFIRNTDNPTTASDWGSRSYNSTRFWVCYVLAAFQDNWRYDKDPDSDWVSGGITNMVNGASLIYLEQLRERYPSAIDKDDLEKRIVIHEVGHSLTLDHGDNTDNPANNVISCTRSEVLAMAGAICAIRLPAASACFTVEDARSPISLAAA